jgi:hypothetical protein
MHPILHYMRGMTIRRLPRPMAIEPAGVAVESIPEVSEPDQVAEKQRAPLTKHLRGKSRRRV